MEVIKKYFPLLAKKQIAQFEALWNLYHEWNQKINVISRKDIDHLYGHHVLHSLTIARYIQFKPKTKVLDLGTGGGFPTIPLAILFPDVFFTAIDGTRKKIKVVQEISQSLGLSNVEAIQIRAEEHRKTYEFVVTRAVAPISKLKEWTTPLIDPELQRHALPNGIIALKGGKVKNEVGALSRKDYYEITPLYDLIDFPYFEEKYILYLQR